MTTMIVSAVVMRVLQNAIRVSLEEERVPVAHRSGRGGLHGDGNRTPGSRRSKLKASSLWDGNVYDPPTDLTWATRSPRRSHPQAAGPAQASGASAPGEAQALRDPGVSPEYKSLLW